MRHDYRLPAGWASMSDAEKDRWMHQERAYRQASRQSTAGRDRIEDLERRIGRRLEANGSVDMEANR